MTIEHYERWEMPQLALHNAGKEPASAEGSAADEASWILPDAEKNKVMLPTADELESIRQEAYDAGFAQGKSEGTQLGQQQVADAVKHLMSIGKDLFDPIAHQREEIEDALLKLAMSLAKSVIKREISLDTSQLIEVVKVMLDQLPLGESDIKLYINPKDLQNIYNHRDILTDQQVSWRFESRESIAAGGCVVETPHTLLDATIDRRYEACVNQIYDRNMSLTLGQVEQHKDPLDDVSDFIEYGPGDQNFDAIGDAKTSSADGTADE